MSEDPGAAAQSPAAGTVLAFDFGLKRIGVATGELALRRAHPLTTIAAADNATRFAAIAALIAEWQPVLLVVGLPRSLDGEEHDMTARCTRFANQLRGRHALPVALADERLTSFEAQDRLRQAGRKPRTGIDAVAAQVILQSYFDETAHR